MVGRKTDQIESVLKGRQEYTEGTVASMLSSSLEQITKFSLILPLLSANPSEVHQESSAQIPSSSHPHLPEPHL